MRLLALTIPFALVACGAGKDTFAGDAPATPTAATAGAPDPATVVASWEGGQVTWGELHEQIGTRLQSMEVEYLMNRYDTQAQALDGMVRDAILEGEAASRGVTLDELLRVEIEEKAAAPSEEEILAFYEANASRMGGATLEEARPFIDMQLRQDKQGERFRVWFGELQASKGLNVALAYPELPRIDVPIAAHDPVFGEADAPVTIVQFAEYECYYCQRALPTLDRLLADYDGRVKLVFKDFPLGFHQRARPAAIAAQCAGEQDKYWDMNHLLLNNQQDLSDAAFRTYAERAGLDLAAFEACLTSGRHDAALDEDMRVAESVGVGATPTFFVDGIMVSGAQPYERFAALVDQALERR
jgi:protein-disulfide isomerase